MGTLVGPALRAGSQQYVHTYSVVTSPSLYAYNVYLGLHQTEIVEIINLSKLSSNITHFKRRHISSSAFCTHPNSTNKTAIVTNVLQVIAIGTHTTCVWSSPLTKLFADYGKTWTLQGRLLFMEICSFNRCFHYFPALLPCRNSISLPEAFTDPSALLHGIFNRRIMLSTPNLDRFKNRANEINSWGRGLWRSHRSPSRNRLDNTICYSKRLPPPRSNPICGIYLYGFGSDHPMSTRQITLAHSHQLAYESLCFRRRSRVFDPRWSCRSHGFRKQF